MFSYSKNRSKTTEIEKSDMTLDFYRVPRVITVSIMILYRSFSGTESILNLDLYYKLFLYK